MTTLEKEQAMECETVTSENEMVAPASRPSKGLLGMSRGMILLLVVLISIIIGLSVAYATDIDPNSIVVENCVNNDTDVSGWEEEDGGSGRDLLCIGGARQAGRSSFTSARTACYNQFYVGGCYRPYTTYYYKLRYAGWIVWCACRC